MVFLAFGEVNVDSVVALQTFHRNVCKVLLDEMVLQRESGLVRFPLEKLSLFSPLFSAAQRMRQGVSPFADGDQGRCPWTLPGLPQPWTCASCAQLDQLARQPF